MGRELAKEFDELDEVFKDFSDGYYLESKSLLLIDWS